ncbi:MAG: flagellar filament capping protein FliD [Geothrix sp.]|nr:flagellar filament capping protein FliD [Geothrix sp.]
MSSVSSTVNSVLSFQGLSTGIQTDALVSAILAQDGVGVVRMQAQEAQNNATSTALATMKTQLNTLMVSLAAVQDTFNARTVTSTDTNNTYVTATATGATAGSYDLSVSNVATKGRISATMVGGVPQNLAVADPTAAIFTSPEASFAVQGTDGVLKTFQLPTNNNSLNGLRDAINASGAGVTAAIVNTGSGANPYQLVISANDTGTGTTNGVVTLAAINNADGTSTVLNPALGITGGTLTGTFAAPTGLTGGLTSTASGASGVNAVFTLNGIQLTRQSNAVSDAVDGITFNLLRGGETGTTTLTVAQDDGAATAGMQTVITNYNALMTTYKTASANTKNSDGSINQAPLGGDQTASGIINQIQSALTGASSGLAGNSAYTNLSSLGVTTNSDGTLSLNSVTFKQAIDKDPAAALRLFTFAGRSTNGAVTVNGGGPQTFTGAVGFTITSYTPGGAVSGIFTGTPNGPITLTGTNGTLSGTGDLAGLSLSVTGTGSGTLTLSRGAGQAVSDLITQDVAFGTGALAVAMANMTTQNNYLDAQIAAGQAMLAQRKTALQNQFSQMEVTVAQMKANAGSLLGA